MVMFMPSQSHGGGVIFKRYTGNIAKELQFYTEKTGKKPSPFYLRQHNTQLSRFVFCLNRHVPTNLIKLSISGELHVFK